MNKVLFFVYFFTVIANPLLGIIVLSRDKKSVINRVFFIFTLFISLWILSLFFFYSIHDESTILIIGRLNFLFTQLLVVFLYIFCSVFPIQKYKISNFIKFLLILENIFLGYLILFTNLIDKEEIIIGTSRTTIYGDLYFLFILHFIFYALYGIYLLVWKWKNFEKLERKQISFVIWGILTGIVFGFSTNILIPLLTSYYDIQNLGPLSTIFFIFFTTYAILKHHLFNIKIVAIEMLTGLMWLVLLAQLVASNSVTDVVVRGSLFVLFTFLSYLLIRAILKEEKHTRQQYEMIATVSHQLRTPLTPIVGLAAMIADGDFDDSDEQKREAELKIYLASRRLNNIINDFLEVFELDSGMRMDVEKSDFIHLIREAMDGVKEDYKTAGLRLSLRNPNKLSPEIKAEPRVFIHAISNLLDNAAKYTKKGGTTITLDEDDKHIILHIKDTGIGLDKEAQYRMFEKFFRSEDARNIRPDGSGLGLAIVKKIIEIHGGKIFAESAGRNKGTIFTMVLPKA